MKRYLKLAGIMCFYLFVCGDPLVSFIPNFLMLHDCAVSIVFLVLCAAFSVWTLTQDWPALCTTHGIGVGVILLFLGSYLVRSIHNHALVTTVGMMDA